MRDANLRVLSYEKYEKARDKAGLNNKQVADAANVPSSTIYDWSAQRYMPKADKLIAIAKVLDVNVEYFFED